MVVSYELCTSRHERHAGSLLLHLALRGRLHKGVKPVASSTGTSVPYDTTVCVCTHTHTHTSAKKFSKFRFVFLFETFSKLLFHRFVIRARYKSLI